MNAHEVLVKARNTIANEHRWTRYAHRDGGRRCSSGALMDASGINDPYEIPGYRALKVAMGTEGCVCAWNDSHSHAEVLAAFDKAIAQTAPQPDTSFLAEVEEAIPA